MLGCVKASDLLAKSFEIGAQAPPGPPLVLKTIGAEEYLKRDSPMSEYDTLIEAAKQARENSHAPFSNFQVGAALRAKSGKDLRRLQRRERQLRAHLLRRARGHFQGDI